ncbi:BNR-4 repeat-containing protein [Neiella sp. HB171785]|uniref:BNR-4 repeat-containing protein n=1 Tax=Neiella litorisoli TaxID=2771431 RepID=A0A8J6QG50_9GAMM|nr:BNR-4 repeat-containing protein [Neiella litorisoli]MBD1388685.1 BNR-4 repeat-containing protein [Neiella litorisoli]
MLKVIQTVKQFVTIGTVSALMVGCATTSNQAAANKDNIYLESETKITDRALFFDGKKMGNVHQTLNTKNDPNGKYDYQYGPAISPHGDAIKTYKHYVFMTWYRGGKYDRHMMLSRLNLKTGQLKHIEFPHQHTGLVGRWWIGETHNTIAVGISPKDETIHLVFDLHAYNRHSDTGGNGSFEKDYFRYSYSIDGAATVSDDDFNLDLFVKDTSSHSEGPDDYKHLSMTGAEDHDAHAKLTYPKFFLNDQGDLFFYIRQGTSHDGKGIFNSYKGNGIWQPFQSINKLNVKENGLDYNWSNYGRMKFANGKLGFGFQRRLNNKEDRYRYQNGVYFMYSDDPLGQSEWKNYKGEPIELPLIAAAPAFVTEPGDLVTTQAKNKVVITGGFDWTITENGDVHIISRVKDAENKVTVHLHHYKPAGQNEFITTTDFVGANDIYTSGGNIYIIGLENGQPYIEQAKGGTNDFKRVYQGKKLAANYKKGEVYIADGKLYYYLLAEGEGDQRTTYLQIINLFGDQ